MLSRVQSKREMEKDAAVRIVELSFQLFFFSFFLFPFSRERAFRAFAKKFDNSSRARATISRN